VRHSSGRDPHRRVQGVDRCKQSPRSIRPRRRPHNVRPREQVRTAEVTAGRELDKGLRIEHTRILAPRWCALYHAVDEVWHVGWM
jgi:hypothetical protein